MTAGAGSPAGGGGSGQTAEGARAGDQPAQAAGGRPGVGHRDGAGRRRGKRLRPAQRRRATSSRTNQYPVSARRAGPVTGPARAPQRDVRQPSTDAPARIARIVALATRFGRYGSRRITAVLRPDGGRVNHKRVERLWRQEGRRVPAKHPKRGRLWLADGALLRRRAERHPHVWSDACVCDRTADGRPLRLLAIVDADTRGVPPPRTSPGGGAATTSWPASPRASSSGAHRPPAATTPAQRAPPPRSATG